MNLAVSGQNYQIQNNSVIDKKTVKNNPQPENSKIINNNISDTNRLNKIAVGKAVSTISLDVETSNTKKISAATQTALKASSSNGITTSLGLSVGGAVAGAVVAKKLGLKVLPVALMGSSIGSLVDRGIGIARNTDKIKDSYITGKTDATKLETAINAVGFALDIGGFVSSAKLMKSANLATKAVSASEAPISEGFRQYKQAEKMVGKNAGAAWENSLTKGIPVPTELAEIKGTSKITGAEAFLDKTENLKLQGSNIKEIVSKVPKEAQLRELTPSPTIKEGFEYAWVDKKSNMDYRLRIHSADLGVAKNNPTSTAAQGWIARVERNPVGQRAFPKTEYLTLDGTYHKATELMAYESQKKDSQLAISVIKDMQTATVGSIDLASGYETVSGVSIIKSVGSNFQQEIQTSNLTKALEEIEHFHHGTHIGLGGGLNKAIVK